MKAENENAMVKLIREAAEECLDSSFFSLRDFFKQILDENCDMIVFISRRCYVLFRIFSIIGGWLSDKVCTDLGIYANREKLKTSSRAIVVDDIVYTGRSIRKVLGRIQSYVNARCQLEAVLYAANKMCIDELQKEDITIKWKFQLTDRQCQETSVHLIETILKTGIPYAIFVYPVWGRTVKELNGYNLYSFKSNMNLFKEYKWETQYLKTGEDIALKWVRKIGEFSCLRVYRNPADREKVCFLPFLFLKSVKADEVNNWYGYIADTFEELRSNDVAEEIRTAINIRAEWRKDAIEYLTCVMSCFCSKALTEVLGLRQYAEFWGEGIINSFKGSFSAPICDMLEKCNEEFEVNFFDRLFQKIENIENIFYSGNQCEDVLADALTEFVLNECEGFDVYESTHAIFRWLKGTESDRMFADGEMKSVYLDDIVYVFREVKHYSYEEIYLAQIECWDTGVATYRFFYDEKRGISAKCTAGEMSSAIFALKYQDLIRDYFREKLKGDFWLKDGGAENDLLEGTLQKAIKEERYTEKEIAVFRKTVKERNGSLYSMLI